MLPCISDSLSDRVCHACSTTDTECLLAWSLSEIIRCQGAAFSRRGLLAQTLRAPAATSQALQDLQQHSRRPCQWHACGRLCYATLSMIESILDSVV